MRDAVINLAWEKLTPIAIEKCWRGIFISRGAEFDEDDDISLSRYILALNPEINSCVSEALVFMNTICPEVNMYIKMYLINFY